MNQPLEPREYIAELKKLRESIMVTTARAQALDEEEKPMVLARAQVGGVDLDLVVRSSSWRKSGRLRLCGKRSCF
jgi:hypothetical protein